MMQLQRTSFALVTSLLIAGALVFAGACGDDDGGGDQEAAADLTSTFENFQRDLQAVGNIEEAPDDIKDSLKDDCADLQDGVDSDRLDDFCDDLEAAIDDESQTEYDQVRARFGTDVDEPFRNEIADRAADSADDDGDGDDDPLQGGDPLDGDDDGGDDNGE